MGMKRIRSAGFVLALSMFLPGRGSSADAVPVALGELIASGDMIENADRSASFEFRVANERADVVVTGFTVTATFYDRRVSLQNVLATYDWSFRSEVLPKGVLLEYGVLDAKAVAGLKKRDVLAKAVYTFKTKVDSQVVVRNK